MSVISNHSIAALQYVFDKTAKAKHFLITSYYFESLLQAISTWPHCSNPPLNNTLILTFCIVNLTRFQCFVLLPDTREEASADQSRTSHDQDLPNDEWKHPCVFQLINICLSLSLSLHMCVCVCVHAPLYFSALQAEEHLPGCDYTHGSCEQPCNHQLLIVACKDRLLFLQKRGDKTGKKKIKGIEKERVRQIV